MQYSRRFLTSALILTLAAAAVFLSGVSNRVAAQPAPFTDNAVVRVYFDDLKTARDIAAWLEPLESQYEKGYLILEVSPEHYDLLVTAGLRVEVDIGYAARMPQTLQGVAPTAQLIPGFACYRTVEETFATAASIASNNPDLATWIDVGDSWEKTQGLGGYDQMVLRLTNANVAGPKPKIFITSAIHAREYTTAELVTRLAEYLVANYGTDADATWMLDHHEIHMMLQTNPDGRKQAETGLSWRKNANRNYCGPTSNTRGADLNRNFDFGWNCCGGSSSNQCSLTYRGASPSSEPETQGVQNYLMSLFPDQRGPNLGDAAPDNASGIYLDVHSSGRLLLWPWGFTNDPAPNGTQLQTLGRKLAFFNGHTPQQSIGLYPTDGTTTSFAYGDMGLAAFTYELGTRFFESCSYFENTLVPDNIPSLLYAIKVARTPYITPAGPDAVNVAAGFGSVPPGVPSGTSINLTATINDTRYNNSNGGESSQAVAAAEYYVDVPPWVDSPTPIATPMSPADGSFNSVVEEVTASIDTSGWSQGRHIIFVRGRDANGTWGAFSAVFVHIDDSAGIPYTILDADFDAGDDGFAYADDTFLGTSQPAYADGARLSSGGSSGGGLQVSLGGIDDADILGMSGGWERSFILDESTQVSLSFLYNLTLASDYEADEFSQVLMSVDGTLYGQGSNNYVVQISGDGNGGGADSSGWQLFETDLGTLPAGEHVLIIGGYNNKKTFGNESTTVLLDEVRLTGLADESSLVPVPDVVNTSQDSAEAAIIDIGLTVGAVTTAPSATVPAGDVISQNPAAGAMAVLGGEVSLVISSGAPPSDVVDWSTTDTVAYSNQDNTGTIEVQEGGLTFFMEGNRWRRTTETFTITPSTTIEFEFRSDAQGEIHGIGFDEDDTLTNDLRIFRIYGTQNWSGDIDWTQVYSGSGSYETFTIPVGQSYTGSGLRLVVVNDKDAGTPNNNSRFRNVRIFEDVSAQ